MSARRLVATVHQTLMATVVIAALAISTIPASASEVPLRMSLQINQLETGTTRNSAGKNMPSYLGTSTTTTYHGDPETYIVPPEGHTSQTIKVPQSRLGGPGAEQWDWGFGIVSGSLFPLVSEAHAGPMYFWAEEGGGFVRSGGDRISMLEARLTEFYTYDVPAEPTGTAGSFTWRTFPEWQTVLRSSTTRYTSAAWNGQSVRSPVPTTTHNQMYLDQAELYASGGDVIAQGGDIDAPEYVFEEPEPPGTVQNFVGISYTVEGPWKDYMDVTADFDAAMDDPVEGEFRLPVNVKLRDGGWVPERRDDPRSASPQYTVPITMIAVPLVANQTGGAEDDILLRSNVAPGTTRVVLMGLRQPDGSTKVRRLVLDEPGRQSWIVRDGRLIEQPQEGHAMAPTKELAQPVAGADLGEGKAGAIATDPPDGPYGGPDDDDMCKVGVNEDGRPELQDLRFDGTTILDRYDVTSVRTPSGVVELGRWNEEVPPVILTHRSGRRARATGIYTVDGSMVVVRLWCDTMVGGFGDYASAYISSHSLDSAPHPHSYRTVLHPPDGAVIHDAVGGPVTTGTRFLPNDLTKRLVVETGGAAYTIGGYYGGTNLQTVTDVGEPARGQPLDDPVIITEDVDQPIISYGTIPLFIEAAPVPGPPPGTFTDVKVYRVVDPFLTGQGVGPPEETRSLDGGDMWGIAFSAQRNDGTPIVQSDVTEMFIAMHTLTGQRLFAGEAPAYWSPDGGGSWGVTLYTYFPLPPMDVVIYASAETANGTISKVTSPSVPEDRWRFAFDRIPVTVTSTSGGSITGTTAPAATVDVSIPELGITASGMSDTDGAFRVPLDLSNVRGGDYQVEVRAAIKGDRAAQDPIGAALSADPLPDEATGFGAGRLSWVAGGQAPDRHGTQFNTGAAVSFLRSSGFSGRFDDTLRATSWAMAGLHGAGQQIDGRSIDYVNSLAAPGGFSWRAGEPANAAAVGLAVQGVESAGAHLGPGAIDPMRFLNWDGGARPSATTELSTIEATGQLATALEATGSLSGFDPYWRERILSYLRASTPQTPLEDYYRVHGASVLGFSLPSVGTAGATAADVAFRVLLGAASAEELGPFQLASGEGAGGLTLERSGDTPEAMATGVALAAFQWGQRN